MDSLLGAAMTASCLFVFWTCIALHRSNARLARQLTGMTAHVVMASEHIGVFDMASEYQSSADHQPVRCASDGERMAPRYLGGRVMLRCPACEAAVDVPPQVAEMWTPVCEEMQLARA